MIEDLGYPVMPTDSLDDEDKSKLDKLCKGKTCDQIRHMGNHLHNHADKISEHAKSTVTYNDYKKAMKRGDMVGE